MQKWIEQRKFVKFVNKNHPQDNKALASVDWQEDEFVSFHNSFFNREEAIDKSDASEIVRNMSQAWGVRIEQLYPEEPSKMNYSWGHSLGARHGVIWVEPNMMYPSYILHEIAHVLIECFINYDLKGKSKIKEEGHGVLFGAIMHNWLTTFYANNDNAMSLLKYWFKPPRLFIAPPEAYDEFKKLFKKRTLL